MTGRTVGAARQPYQTWLSWPTLIMAVAGFATGLANIGYMLSEFEPDSPCYRPDTADNRRHP
ncbi:MAG: hypothetical protein CL388_04410 [Acidiferrobacteraceae bacterium]|nr:hypothetical protein [Acidiferrobacteraceae bacterium]MDP6434065.1 hypothetical protein [Arenicellales bacterium]MDP6672950.1 hypothetical protein [Arenicellales bacterium]MDP6724844.1 hypothetical protein [Arenicellales bacterium]